MTPPKTISLLRITQTSPCGFACSMKSGALLDKTGTSKHGSVNPWIEAKSGALGYTKKHLVRAGSDGNQKQQLVTDEKGRAVQMNEMVQDQVHQNEVLRMENRKKTLEALERYDLQDKMSDTVSIADPLYLVQVFADASTDGGPASMSDGSTLPQIKMP